MALGKTLPPASMQGFLAEVRPLKLQELRILHPQINLFQYGHLLRLFKWEFLDTPVQALPLAPVRDTDWPPKVRIGQLYCLLALILCNIPIDKCLFPQPVFQQASHRQQPGKIRFPLCIRIPKGICMPEYFLIPSKIQIQGQGLHHGVPSLRLHCAANKILRHLIILLFSQLERFRQKHSLLIYPFPLFSRYTL